MNPQISFSYLFFLACLLCSTACWSRTVSCRKLLAGPQSEHGVEWAPILSVSGTGPLSVQDLPRKVPRDFKEDVHFTYATLLFKDLMRTIKGEPLTRAEDSEQFEEIVSFAFEGPDAYKNTFGDPAKEAEQIRKNEIQKRNYEELIIEYLDHPFAPMSLSPQRVVLMQEIVRQGNLDANKFIHYFLHEKLQDPYVNGLVVRSQDTGSFQEPIFDFFRGIQLVGDALKPSLKYLPLQFVVPPTKLQGGPIEYIMGESMVFSQKILNSAVFGLLQKPRTQFDDLELAWISGQLIKSYASDIFLSRVEYNYDIERLRSINKINRYKYLAHTLNERIEIFKYWLELYALHRDGELESSGIPESTLLQFSKSLNNIDALNVQTYVEAMRLNIRYANLLLQLEGARLSELYFYKEGYSKVRPPEISSKDHLRVREKWVSAVETAFQKLYYPY